MQLAIRSGVVLGVLVLCACTETKTERESHHAEVDRILAETRALPLLPGVARVTIHNYTIDERDRAAIDAAVKYRADHVGASAGHLGGRSNGVTIHASTGDIDAALRVSRASRFSRSHTESFLVLNEGSSGSLQVLQVRREPWLVVVPVYRGALLVRTFREEVTGTGMFVRVDRAGRGMAAVTLTPYFNRARDGRAIRVEELATTVTLRHGVPYVIMHADDQRQTIGEALLSYSSTTERRRVIATLMVEVGR